MSTVRSTVTSHTLRFEDQDVTSFCQSLWPSFCQPQRLTSWSHRTIACVRLINLDLYHQVSGWAVNWGTSDINICRFFFLDWSDSLERNLSMSFLEGKGLVTGVLVAKWGRGLEVSAYGIWHAYNHLIFFISHILNCAWYSIVQRTKL